MGIVVISVVVRGGDGCEREGRAGMDGTIEWAHGAGCGLNGVPRVSRMQKHSPWATIIPTGGAKQQHHCGHLLSQCYLLLTRTALQHLRWPCPMMPQSMAQRRYSSAVSRGVTGE